MRAIVVGAGTAGLSAGIALRRAGIDALVLEKAPEPRRVGAGLHLWSNALLVLRRLGAEDAVRTAGAELENSVFFSRRGRLMAEWPVGDAGRELGAPTMGVRRADLQEALLDATEPGTVRYGATVTGFDQDHEGASVRLDDGSTERGDVLIGADGLESGLRATLLGHAPPKYTGYAGWRSVIDWEDEPFGRFKIYSGRGLRFVCYPVGPGKLYWLATANEPQGGKDDVPRLNDVLGERYADFPDPVPAILAAAPAESIIRSDIVDRDPVKRWGEGRVTLAGDAAHPMTPNLAMGAVTALEDAVVLARHLSGAGGVPAALRTYERERMQRTAPLTKRSRLLGRLGHWSNPTVVAVRDGVTMPLFLRIGFWQTKRDIDFAG